MGVQQSGDGVVTAPELVSPPSRGPNRNERLAVHDEELGPTASTWRARRARCHDAFCKVVCSPGTWKQRILCVLFWLLVVAALVAIFVILVPRALARPIQALINLLLSKLTRSQLAAICFAAVAIAPCTMVLPMMPFIWIAGIAFDFGKAFGIAMAGTFVGMSMQYWAARYLFKDKVERHLLKRRKDGISVALRAVDIAGPWKVVALVRLGPSPYAAMNYIFGVCPQIKYHQYIIASMICVSHHRALSVFFGHSMPSLAQLFSGGPVTNVGAAVYRFILLALAIILCVVIVIVAKKALKKIEEQELEREAQEAAAAAAAEAAADPEAGTPDVCASIDAASTQKLPLPLAVEEKLADAGAGSGAFLPLDHKSTGSGSEGDLQVIVVDSAPAPAPVLDSNSTDVSRQGSFIPAGQLPPAAMETDASTSSRMSSVSSLRALLGGRNQRFG